MTPNNDNEHSNTVLGFGDEWSRFDQSGATAQELERTLDKYFAIFPWARLPQRPRGADVGCGSGRWARLVAPRDGELHCVDASAEALAIAKRNLSDQTNVRPTQASVGALPFEDASFDFAYSLGVLHHVPDTLAGMRECARANFEAGRALFGLPLLCSGQSSGLVSEGLESEDTALEQRFTRVLVEQMMRQVGLTEIRFLDSVPFWCAVGFRQS